MNRIYIERLTERVERGQALLERSRHLLDDAYALLRAVPRKRRDVARRAGPMPDKHPSGAGDLSEPDADP
ncbi:MAG TPA: hypothetical protein VFE42_18380 [Chloroflexota bacterium]|nr:hypothetical protein [Chloroflexota bacterium]